MFTRREIIRINETLNILPADGDQVLEVGVGDGRITERLIKKYPNITCIDIDADKIAKLLVKDEKKKVADIADLPFPDNSFDLIVCLEVLEHLDDTTLNKAVNELKRASRKYILISVPYSQDFAAYKVKCPSCKNVFQYYPWGHVQSFKKGDLEKHFKNWSINKAKYIKIWPHIQNFKFTLWLKQKILGAYYENKDIICPQCKNKALSCDTALLKILLRKTISMVEILLSIFFSCLYVKSSWQLFLFEKRK